MTETEKVIADLRAGALEDAARQWLSDTWMHNWLMARAAKEREGEV